ncbi:MAG: DUF2786 domain-containing protein [Polyangiales bacterium]
MNASEQLSADLEAAALRALAATWGDYNHTYFRGLMRPPALGLADARGSYARWVREHRRIEFARHALRELTWGQIDEVLKHEMAHQYVDEVLGRLDETAHGPAFQRVCEDRGIDARASGAPEHAPTAEEKQVLERIARLLALAGSPNEHEAQAAMNAARRLMLKHNLDAGRAKAARGFVFRNLGEAVTRIDEATSYIGTILAEFFFVEVITVRVWRVREGRHGSVLEVTGTPENVAMAEYVFSFLNHTADALWTLHKRQLGIRGDKDRRQFRAGVMRGFWEKLGVERKSNEASGLIWVGDPALSEFFRKRFPRIRSVTRGGGAKGEAYDHGRSQGRELVLRKGVDGGGGDRGLRLGPGSRA